MSDDLSKFGITIGWAGSDATKNLAEEAAAKIRAFGMPSDTVELPPVCQKPVAMLMQTGPDGVNACGIPLVDGKCPRCDARADR